MGVQVRFFLPHLLGVPPAARRAGQRVGRHPLPSSLQRITVRAVTPCEYCVFHVKEALKQEEHDTICRLVEKGVGRLQRLITCPAIQ